MILLSQLCLVATLLLVWFKSEAFIEYSKLFRVQNLFFIPLFEKERDKDISLSYLEYLSLEHDCFFVRLITCPLCLGFWFSVLTVLVIGNFYSLPIIYIGGILLYGVTSKVLE